jgi:4-amino-4-deoxy-L-arabinose transferase-like glycosyltransferase
MPLRSSRWVLVVILAVCCFIRLWYLHAQVAVVDNEGATYAMMAENLYHGRGFLGPDSRLDLVETWLYPSLIALLMFVVRNSETAARIICFTCGVGLVLPVYGLARRLYGQTAGWIAGSLIAVFPLLIALSASMYTEALHLTLLMTAAYWAVRSMVPEDSRAPLWCGLFLGLSYLNRPESLALVPWTILFLILAGWIRQSSWRQIARASAEVLILVTLLAAPYIILLHHFTGQFRLEGKSNLNYTLGQRMRTGIDPHDVSYGIDEQMHELGPLLNQDRFVTSTPYPHHFRDWLAYFLYAAKVNKYWIYNKILPSFALGSPFLLLFLVLGLFGKPWDRARALSEAYLLGIVCFTLLLLLGIHSQQARFAFPLIPFFLLWTSCGVLIIYHWAKETAASVLARPLAAPRIALLCAGGLLLLMMLFSLRGLEDLTPLESESLKHLPIKQAGLWLGSYRPGPKGIFGSAVVSYYAGGAEMFYPYADARLALQYIHLKNPDFLVLDADHAGYYPYYTDWLENGIPDPAAQLIYSSEKQSTDRILIYAWKRVPTSPGK